MPDSDRGMMRMSELRRQANALFNDIGQAAADAADTAGDLGSSDGNGGDGTGSGGSVSSPTTGTRLSFSNDSQKLILVAMTITVIVALVENAHKDSTKDKSYTPPSTIIIGGFVSGAILLGLSYFIPEFASGLAIVAMVATVLEKGNPFWNIVLNLTGTPLPKTGTNNPPNITPGDASVVEVPASSIPGGPGNPQVYVGPGQGINVHI